MFSTHGDSSQYPSDTCWSYLGWVYSWTGSPGRGTDGYQTVNFHKDCINFETALHLLLHSLGLTHQDMRGEDNSSEVNLSNMLRLAMLYQESAHYSESFFASFFQAKSCFKSELIPEYFELLVKDVADLKKSCHKDSYYLYLSDKHILRLPGFTKATCSIEPYPVKQVNPGVWGVRGAVAAILDGRLHVCGGGPGEAESSCHALHSTKWYGMPRLSLGRLHAGSSKWQGGWLITGGFSKLYGNNRGVRHNTSEFFTGGGWSPGPDLDKTKFWTGEPLMGIESHCQVTTGGMVIIAGGRSERYNGSRTISYGIATGATFSWSGNSWTQLSSMKIPRANHACVETEGVLFAMGGENQNGDSLGSVERLNLATMVWSEGPDLPYNVSHVQAVNIHGDIHVVGGRGSEGKILRLVGNTWVVVSDYGGYDGEGVFSNPPILTKDQIMCL